MKRVMMTALAAAATVAFASPAVADVTSVPASSVQGTLVHGTGTETTAPTVTADLGSNGPNIVNFNGTTNGPNNNFMLQGGSGQADVTGATITNNNTYDILTGNIYLTNYQGMQDIEFGLTSGVAGTVNFVISALSATGAPETFNFTENVGTGDTFYAFLASNGESITNVYFSAGNPPTAFSLIKQVRIDLAAGAVPEPATWAMMLLGFGGIGVAMRRRRKDALAQIA
jgi:hypothetical protein